MIGNGHQVKFRNGKKIGIIRSDGVFQVWKRKGTRTHYGHFFWLYNGWGMNRELINELLDVQTHTIEIVTSDTKEIYTTSIINFLNKGIPYRNPKGEKDRQLILPLSYWKVRPMEAKLETWIK